MVRDVFITTKYAIPVEAAVQPETKDRGQTFSLEEEKRELSERERELNQLNLPYIARERETSAAVVIIRQNMLFRRQHVDDRTEAKRQEAERS